MEPVACYGCGVELLAGFALAAFVFAGCGPRAEESPPEPETPIAAANQPAGPRPRGVVELDDAVAALDSTAVSKWLNEARYRPTDRPVEPTPEMRRAIDALIAWDRSALGFAVGCDDLAMVRGRKRRPWFAVVTLAKIVFAVARSADDPAIHAVLRIGQALRDPGNPNIAILAGLSLATNAAKWLGERQLQPSVAFRTYAPSADTAFHVARGHLRCELPQLARANRLEDLSGPQDWDPGKARGELEAARGSAGMAVEPGWMDREFVELRTFWRDTETSLATARTAAEVIAIVEQRAAIAKLHATSILVRMTGASGLWNYLPRAVDDATKAVRDYAAAIGERSALGVGVGFDASRR